MEEEGCRAGWFTDHLFFPHDTPEPLTIAAVAAASTSRCFIGTGVLQAPLRPAALVAKAAATVDALAPGRLILGVGIGEQEQEFQLAGADFSARARSLDEAIDRWRALWQPGVGRFVQKPTPGRIPIWIGGRSSAALDRVVRQGDGWMPMFVSTARFARGIDELDSRLSDLERPAESVVRSVLVLVSVDSERWSATDARNHADSIFDAPPEALERHVVTGSAGQVAEKLAGYRDAGANHVAVLPMHPDPADVFASISAEMPHT